MHGGNGNGAPVGRPLTDGEQQISRLIERTNNSIEQYRGDMPQPSSEEATREQNFLREAFHRLANTHEGEDAYAHALMEVEDTISILQDVADDYERRRRHAREEEEERHAGGPRGGSPVNRR